MGDATSWTYAAGEKGKTRVRVFDRGEKGLYAEWFEPPCTPGAPKRRVRRALGHTDRERAKGEAEALALAFRKQEGAPRRGLTLGELFDIYGAEVTPQKGVSKRQHDARAAEMFARYFGRNRRPHTLSRRDWDRFIADRRAGRVVTEHGNKNRSVGDRVVAYHLKYLLAVFAWAAVAGDGEGGRLLERNPLKGLPIPTDESPRRVVIMSEEYQKLRKVAPKVHPDFECLLVIAHETGHRLSAIRQLRWSDVNTERRTVRWQAVSDKIGFEHSTPLTDAAIAVLVAQRRRAQAIGDAWVFPSDENPSEPRPRITFGKWWYQAEKLAELGRLKGRGYHSLRRQFATEMKDTPLKDLAYLGGWKDPGTLLTCYQQPDEGTQRRALEGRRQLKASGLE
jgi:integrase